jgi:hypothetical protein
VTTAPGRTRTVDSWRGAGWVAGWLQVVRAVFDLSAAVRRMEGEDGALSALKGGWSLGEEEEEWRTEQRGGSKPLTTWA